MLGAGKQGGALELKHSGTGAMSVHSGEIRLSLAEEEEPENAEGQSLLSQQQAKSDEPENGRSKVCCHYSASRWCGL